MKGSGAREVVMNRFVTLVVLLSFWLVQVVAPYGVAAANLWGTPTVSPDGRLGFTLGVSIPIGKEAPAARSPEPVLLAANTVPPTHKVVENTPYDHNAFYTQAMGRPTGYTSKEEFVVAVAAGKTQATMAQYREALTKVGVQLADDAALEAYFGSLEWVSNSNNFNSRMGRLLVNRKTGEKMLDSGFVREVEANEFVLLDGSAKPPRPIIAGDCGNVILGVIGATTPTPTAAVVPPPTAPAPKPEVRSVVITPTETPAPRQQATGYGMFEQREQIINPAIYKEPEEKGHGKLIAGGLLVAGLGILAYVLFGGKGGDDKTTTTTTTNNTTTTTEVPVVVPVPVPVPVIPTPPTPPTPPPPSPHPNPQP